MRTNPKIVLIDPLNNETIVATFRSLNEAFQCASLLQAMINTPEYIYYVDYFMKGKGMRRTQPDSFTSMVWQSTNLSEKLKLRSLVS